VDDLSPNAKVERTIVWVRFPGLNLVYYDESFLMAMASAIGKPIKVDINTLKVERGRFARVCVEVDLTVSVVGKIWVNGHWYKVQYEGLHIICTNCGCYGHLGRNSPLATPVPIATIPLHQAPSLAPPHPNTQVNQSNPTQPQGNTVNTDVVLKEANRERNINNNEESKELHGDWLLVTRRKKQPNMSPVSDSKTVNNNKGNKFNALSNLTHQPNDSPTIQKFPPRPHATNIARPIKTNENSKRRRQDDDIIQKTPISPFPTNLTRPIPSVPFQQPMTTPIVSGANNSDVPTQKPPIQVNINIDQLATTQHKNDPPDTILSDREIQTHNVNNDLASCAENHVHSPHNEGDMVS
jgi:hypothetical protein